MDKTVICGYVDHIIYQNADNGQLILCFEDKECVYTAGYLFFIRKWKIKLS